MKLMLAALFAVSIAQYRRGGRSEPGSGSTFSLPGRRGGRNGGGTLCRNKISSRMCNVLRRVYSCRDSLMRHGCLQSCGGCSGGSSRSSGHTTRHRRRSRYGRRSRHTRRVAARNIVQLAQATADLSTLVSAVVEAQLVNTLSGPGPFTVFAPTNEAFAMLPPSTLRSLLQPSNRAKLQAILEYHVLPGKVTSTQLKPNSIQAVRTVEGQPLEIRKHDGHVYVGTGGAEVTTANVKASNGVVHIINRVLIPPSHRSSHNGIYADDGTTKALVSFRGQGLNENFRSTNDPVMGGQSRGYFTREQGYGLWQGEVKVVPSLHAPGFCKIGSRTAHTNGFALGQYSPNPGRPGIAMVLRPSSATQGYKGYKISLAGDKVPRHHRSHSLFGSYKADFSFPSTTTTSLRTNECFIVKLAWDGFSSDWSDYTGSCSSRDPDGYQHRCCNKGGKSFQPVCPTRPGLNSIREISLWAEGVAGQFELKVFSISAVAHVSTGSNSIMSTSVVPCQ